MPNVDDQEKHFAVFLENLLTIEDIRLLEDDIEAALALIYSTTSQVLSQKVSSKVSAGFQKIIAGLETNNILPSKNQEQEAFFLALRKYLKQIPIITLNLAFEPKREFIERLASWFSTNLSRKIVLNIEVRREIIAGVIIEYNGKYGDYSKSRQLDEVVREYYENVQ